MIISFYEWKSLSNVMHRKVHIEWMDILYSLNECDPIDSMWIFQLMPFDGDLQKSIKFFYESDVPIL